MARGRLRGFLALLACGLFVLAIACAPMLAANPGFPEDPCEQIEALVGTLEQLALALVFGLPALRMVLLVVSQEEAAVCGLCPMTPVARGVRKND